MFGEDAEESDLVMEHEDHPEMGKVPYCEAQLHPEWHQMFNGHEFPQKMEMPHHHGMHHHGHHHHDDHPHGMGPITWIKQMIAPSEQEEEKKQTAQEESSDEDSVTSMVARRLKAVVGWVKNEKEKEKKTVVIDEEKEKERKEFEDVMDELQKAPHMKHQCSRCYAKVMKFVMGMAVKHAAMYCKKNQKCPFLKKMCMFARKHKAFTFGALLAMVQPEKFAMGRCWHKDHGDKKDVHMIDMHDKPRSLLDHLFGGKVHRLNHDQIPEGGAVQIEFHQRNPEDVVQDHHERIMTIFQQMMPQFFNQQPSGEVREETVTTEELEQAGEQPMVHVQRVFRVLP